MIKANTNRKWLPLYEALASEVRLRILELLAEKSMNLKEMASQLKLSSAIITMHIRKLEAAGLIETRMVRKDGGTHKICSLAETSIEVTLPQSEGEIKLFYEQNIPVGHYTAFEVHPTCGLATRSKVIGQFDDPRFFLDPERVSAAILWLGKGYVEYKTPNYLHPSQVVEELEIAMEIASEAPGLNDHWPSDIAFSLNGIPLGIWTSPGDFGESSRGRFTPDWWSKDLNQYGLWKVLRVTRLGTYMDGQLISNTTLDSLLLENHFWTLRFSVDEISKQSGGLTLYGSGFGNYNKDIQFRVYYSQRR